MGAAQREHLNCLNFLRCILHCIDLCDDRNKNSELLVLMEVLSFLALRCENHSCPPIGHPTLSLPPLHFLPCMIT